MKKHRKTGRVISVDLSDVETRELLPADDYAVKVKKVEQEEGDKGDYLNWNLVVSQGDFKGSTLWHITSLTKQSLWNLRATLEAMGREIPKSLFDLDLDDLEGEEFGVTVEIEKYRGKNKNTVVDVFALEEEEEEEEEKGKKKPKEEEEEVDLDEMSLKELVKYAEKNDIELTEKAKASASRARRAIRAAEEE